MLTTTANTSFSFSQRIIFVIMLVVLQFYYIGSDFFPDSFVASPVELIDMEMPEVLDFDDHASLRTLRQEQIHIRLFAGDFMIERLEIIDLHDLIHLLELRQSTLLPLFYNLHKAEIFVWFCTYLI